MGFAVTATHLIFAVALLSAGSFAAASYWRVNGEIEEARRAEAERAEQIAHTSIWVTAVAYNSGADRVEFDVRNNGTVVLVISEMTYLIDGVWKTDDMAAGYPKISGAPSTDLLLPGETMSVRIEDVAQAPTNIAVVAGNGVAGYWT